MGTPGLSGTVWRFGPFTMDGRSLELRREGVPIKLQDQPARILLYLLERPSEMVSRDELQRALWSADTFVDFDHSLNTAVMKLREALGDAAGKPQYIETLPKKGYRFIAPVEAVRELADSEPAIQKTALVPRSLGIIKVAGAALAILAILAGAIWFSHVRHPAQGAQVERRLTANTSELAINGAALSPDGKFLAYSDPTGLSLLQMDNREVRPLHLPDGFTAVLEGWFPDSTHLLVSSMGPQATTSLWKISIVGGGPQKLIDNASWAAVSPDGTHVAFLRISAPVPEPYLWQMRSDGTEVEMLMKPGTPAANGDFSWNWFGRPAWSPDGTHLAVMRWEKSYAGRPNRLETYAIADGRSQIIVKSSGQYVTAVWWSADGHVFYSRDDRWELGETSVWSIPVDQRTGTATGAEKKLSTGTGLITAMSATADGKHLAFLRVNAFAQTFVAEFAEPTHVLQRLRRLTLDGRPNYPFDWTPDSKTVFFISNRRGVFDIFKQGIDQKNAEVVVADRYNNYHPRLSPDGSSLYYRRNPNNSEHALMKVPLSGDPPQLVGLYPPGYDGDLRCARAPATLCDVALGSPNHTNDTIVVFAMDGRTGKIGRELTHVNVRDADYSAAISPDGTQLAMLRDGEREGRLRFVRVSDGVARDVVVKGWARLQSLDWSADSKTILTTSVSPEGDSVLLEVDLDGNASVIFTAENHARIGYGIAAPDGRHVAVNQTVGENNVWMRDNF